MKIKLIDPATKHVDANMDIKGQEVELEGVYTGVGIKTEQGHIGICERNGGVEVLLDSKVVFASYSDVGRLEAIHEKITTLHQLLQAEGADPATLRLVGEINEAIPGRIKAKFGSDFEVIDPDAVGPA